MRGTPSCTEDGRPTESAHSEHADRAVGKSPRKVCTSPPIKQQNKCNQLLSKKQKNFFVRQNTIFPYLPSFLCVRGDETRNQKKNKKHWQLLQQYICTAKTNRAKTEDSFFYFEYNPIFMQVKL